MAFANQRHDHVSGGNDRIALPLNAASVTTNAGNTRKPRMTRTAVCPIRRNKRSEDKLSEPALCKGRGFISVQANSLERPRGEAHENERRQGESEAGDGQARGERKVKACKAERVDEIGDHVDPAAADKLRGC